MSVKQSTLAFPEHTRMHYSSFLVYALRTIYDSLSSGNIDTAWSRLKAFVSMLPARIRLKVWRKIVEAEEEAEETANNAKGVDAYTTLRKRESKYRDVLSEKIYGIIQEITQGLEDMGLLYEKYTIEEEE